MYRCDFASFEVDRSRSVVLTTEIVDQSSTCLDKQSKKPLVEKELMVDDRVKAIVKR